MHRELMKKVGAKFKGEDDVRKFARSLLPDFVVVKKTIFDQDNIDTSVEVPFRIYH